MSSKGTILVTGATGMQGGAVVDALLPMGFVVRALVRDPAGAAARALASRGVEIAQGDFDDPASLDAALAGVTGVFSMQNPPAFGDTGSEVRAGRNLVDAALRAGTEQFVHTSVARAGEQESFAGWAEKRWWPKYWDSKSAVNDMVRAAGFPHWTVLLPAFMMENLLPPKAAWMFPHLVDGEVVTALDPGTRLDFIAAADVGRMAAAAFADPARFDGKDIPLAVESLTMDEVAAAIGAATGRAIEVRHLSEPDAVAAGLHAGLAESQRWASVEGYRVDLTAAASHGVALEDFADWAVRHAGDFAIN